MLNDADRELLSRFEEDRFAALYSMGLQGGAETAGASAAFLTLLSDTFFKRLTDLPDLELLRENARAALSEQDIESLLRAVPFALGAEHITEKWLQRQCDGLNEVFAREMGAYSGTVALYLAERSQNLRVPERVFFHLVENKDDEYPFAFLATYATRDEKGTVRHMPLQYALTEYRTQREKLLELLSCLNRAAEVSGLVAEFMESGEMFHMLRLTAAEAYAFLTQIEAIENAGILCRIPNWWKKKAAAVRLTLRLGEEKPSMLGFDSLISVQPRLEVDGVALTEEDIRSLLAQSEGLALLKGKWVAVDHARLRALLNEMEASPESLTLLDALRLELGTGKPAADIGALVSNGEWLGALLRRLRRPETIRSAVLPRSFHAQLRPYQKTGYTWLRYMDELGFGACLADDMGLGKTVQVLAYLEKLRKTKKEARVLLIVPASLLGNWEMEAERFAPDMERCVLHGKPSAALSAELEAGGAFLTITTYGIAARLKDLQAVNWDCVILDEAQAIKNPLTKQTREIKKLPCRMRIAMTGTPIENDLTNLWSLFDFLNKGLLGSSEEFRRYCARLREHPEGYARLKAMVAPFLLRRMKTDKRIIEDLPDKLEMNDYVTLSKRQVVLYRKTVSDMERRILESEGIERRGIVLGTILRLKQICNHPDQYLGQDAFAEEDSGKLQMLRELCETIRDKRERVLVFTQFREITDALSRFLTEVFGMPGQVLDGGTPVPARKKIVETFQGERYVPYLVLSVRAGGTGLNLTKASHVIHFDRWWNPAVENQATDRAYRIGQTERVMVHKLVCRGTIEEKIDAMIEGKKELAESVIGGGAEKWLTELNNDELLQMLRLDVR
ncbi:MAG: DEAD/DEAH box helicase [Oscillospiraceae bacterium]|nr:DEAD/DEAH box helicase [Oscillospiraceae bacterium]